MSYIIESKYGGSDAWHRYGFDVYDKAEAEDTVKGLCTSIMEVNDPDKYPYNCGGRELPVVYEFRVVPFVEEKPKYTKMELYENVNEWNKGWRKRDG